LLLGLGFAYLGEYNSLISLLEYSKQFGGNNQPVALYIVYSLSLGLLADPLVARSKFVFQKMKRISHGSLQVERSLPLLCLFSKKFLSFLSIGNIGNSFVLDKSLRF